MTLFPQSNRTPATDGKPPRNQPKLQGSDVLAENQQEEAEAPLLDPTTGKAGKEDFEQDAELDLQPESHPTPDHPTGRMGV